MFPSFRCELLNRAGSAAGRGASATASVTGIAARSKARPAVTERSVRSAHCWCSNEDCKCSCSEQHPNISPESYHRTETLEISALHSEAEARIASDTRSSDLQDMSDNEGDGIQVPPSFFPEPAFLDPISEKHRCQRIVEPQVEETMPIFLSDRIATRQDNPQISTDLNDQCKDEDDLESAGIHSPHRWDSPPMPDEHSPPMPDEPSVGMPCSNTPGESLMREASSSMCSGGRPMQAQAHRLMAAVEGRCTPTTPFWSYTRGPRSDRTKKPREETSCLRSDGNDCAPLGFNCFQDEFSGVDSGEAELPDSDLMTVQLRTREQRIDWRDFLVEMVANNRASSLFLLYDVDAEAPRYARPPPSKISMARGDTGVAKRAEENSLHDATASAPLCGERTPIDQTESDGLQTPQGSRLVVQEC